MNRRDFCVGAMAGIGMMGGMATAAVGGRHGAIDTHAHVFLHDLDFAPGRRYTPTYDASPEDYLARLDANGIFGGVLVQPSFLGVDNSYMLDALDKYPDRLRGIAVVQHRIDRTDIAAMRRRGVVGVRWNLMGQSDPDFASPEWRSHLAELKRVDWTVEVYVQSARFPAIAKVVLDHDLRLIVDHFGSPDIRSGIDDPGFRFLRSLGAGGRTWVKMSADYRLGLGEAGRALARDAAQALLRDIGPDHLMWGSDWPHTGFEGSANYAQTRAVLDRWVPDEPVRNQVLASTPARLFGFDRHNVHSSRSNSSRTY